MILLSRGKQQRGSASSQSRLCPGTLPLCTDGRAGRSVQCDKQQNDLIVPLGGPFPRRGAREVMRETQGVHACLSQGRRVEMPSPCVLKRTEKAT